MKKILVSECLYGGRTVRYDARDVVLEDPRFLKWKAEGRLVPICPEVFGGLPVPRPDSQRVGDKVLTSTGKDVTAEYAAGAVEARRLAEENDVAFAMMKLDSPSCGSKLIYDGTFTGNKISGQGLAVEYLRNAGITVLGEDDIDEAEKLIAIQKEETL
ncbi:MAG: DUF523 domain-containing protein [Clostridiales Family XIII bacterium]|jgi:uncharacterized protein YbbK (DUF523 family)|nr:DUF523 domain-containing protein [Clostridiales Family XIII bacterium]